jgi:ATP-dependent Lhr-like helicase
MDDAGRWALLRRGPESRGVAETLEHVAMTLLRRYGVVFWRLLSARRIGCRAGANCCAPSIGWRPVARFAAGALSVVWRGAVCLARGDSAAARSRRRPHDGSLIAVCGLIR